MAPLYETTSPVAEITEEWIEAIINVFINATFIVGSIFFFEGWPIWSKVVGDLIFIVGSFITFLIAGRKLMLKGWSNVAQSLMHPKKQGEIIVILSYCLSSFIFFIGAFFYFPGIYPDKATEHLGEQVGAWLFIIGSFGFLLASFYSMEALGHSHPIELDYVTLTAVHYMHRLALLSIVFGCNFFVVGSFFYRPVFNTHCNKLKAISQAHVNEGFFCKSFCGGAERALDSISSGAHTIIAEGCADNFRFGTWCYVIGCVLFTVSSILELRMISLKQRCVREHTAIKKAK